ncbi:hypothetical protein A9507_01930 [Methanobacterium sp. A39]|uniref:Uncharacterized protein n=1 Tax=Methanobacterium bryantii TaxID=2161 RepID=A0A2A2H697_METBR|nr:hypothetical protein A9507_01930 [Methanobacterium sp. A39]PAV04845.1 hypothetical protein ASJ80_11075 [Methanobacterium bryantii]
MFIRILGNDLNIVKDDRGGHYVQLMEENIIPINMLKLTIFILGMAPGLRDFLSLNMLVFCKLQKIHKNLKANNKNKKISQI